MTSGDNSSTVIDELTKRLRANQIGYEDAYQAAIEAADLIERQAAEILNIRSRADRQASTIASLYQAKASLEREVSRLARQPAAIGKEAVLTSEQREAIAWAVGKAHVAALGRIFDSVEGRRWRVLSNLLIERAASTSANVAQLDMSLEARLADAEADVKRLHAEKMELWNQVHGYSANVAQGSEAVAWFTDDSQSDKSATTWDRNVAERWRTKGWPVSPLYVAPPAQTANVAQGAEADTQSHLTSNAVKSNDRQIAPTAQIGKSEEADFERGTWTFRMRPGFIVTAGEYLIVQQREPGEAGDADSH